MIGSWTPRHGVSELVDHYYRVVSSGLTCDLHVHFTLMPFCDTEAIKWLNVEYELEKPGKSKAENEI